MTARANVLDHVLIRRLFEGGMSRAAIARQILCSKSSVARIVTPLVGSGSYGSSLGSVKVLEDPLDLFVGGIFNEVNLRCSLAQGVFANGTKFQLGKNGRERTATVIDGILVCESDNQYLHVSPSGGAGGWHNIEVTE